MAVKEYGYDLEDLLAVLRRIVMDKKVADVALLNTKCMKSITTFNNVNEMLEYINATYCDSIIIKKIGAKTYTERLYLHQFNGFKLNEKSILIYLRTTKPTGKYDTKSIRF